MGDSLEKIAKHLCSPRVLKKAKNKTTEAYDIPKVQLIYAFNGTGKTRLSREFIKIFTSQKKGLTEEIDQHNAFKKLFYYNAFTEDLFYWQNGTDQDDLHKLNIRPNKFTDWLLIDQGKDQEIIARFQQFTNDKLTPQFNQKYDLKNERDEVIGTVPAFKEVTFSLKTGDDGKVENLKISKGEESLFIWCIFSELLELIIETLKEPEPADRDTNEFDQLEYIFIDDPVSSLDENHLIDLAVAVAEQIKKSDSGLKFILTTHNPLFYNVLYNELNNKQCYYLDRHEDGTFTLLKPEGDSNKSFSYHHHLMRMLEEAIATKKIEKFHFTLLRNLYEKTAGFLGYKHWKNLLPNDRDTYYKRIITFSSHRSLSNEEFAQPTEQEKRIVKYLFDHLTDNFGFFKQDEQNG